MKPWHKVTIDLLGTLAPPSDRIHRCSITLVDCTRYPEAIPLVPTKQRPSSLTWDDPVPSELTVKWVYRWNDLTNLSTVLFDRCVISTEFSDGAIELHHFCDGFQLAYAACCYIRISSETGSTHVQLLAAKAGMMPLRTMTTAHDGALFSQHGS